MPFRFQFYQFSKAFILMAKVLKLLFRKVDLKNASLETGLKLMPQFAQLFEKFGFFRA